MGVDRYSRNEALFGVEGQARIAATKVAIGGLGGVGGPVAQQLAYLGVRDFAVIDFDVVTDSSLNRLVGAIDADVQVAAKKIAIATRMIRSIQPNATITPVDGRIDTPDAIAAIAAADVVFGCLDRDLPRLHLASACARYAKTLFDLASDTGGGDEPWYGGRVVFCDGTRCVVCLGLLDQEEMRRDAMSPDQRAAHERIYGVRANALDGTGPMVVSINGIVASLAVTEFMAHITGLRAPMPHLIYRGDQQIIRRSVDEPESDCYYCSGLWGSAL